MDYERDKTYSIFGQPQTRRNKQQNFQESLKDVPATKNLSAFYQDDLLAQSPNQVKDPVKQNLFPNYTTQLNYNPVQNPKPPKQYTSYKDMNEMDYFNPDFGQKPPRPE